MSSQAEKIRGFILNNISKHPADIVAITATQFSVTRTTIHRHLNILLKKNLIFKSGTTRNLRYYTALSLDRNSSIQLIKSFPNLMLSRMILKIYFNESYMPRCHLVKEIKSGIDGRFKGIVQIRS